MRISMKRNALIKAYEAVENIEDGKIGSFKDVFELKDYIRK